jgi:hypothetical protein
MKATFLLCLLLLTRAAHAQTTPETDGAYYSSKDAAAARTRKPFGPAQDSTLHGTAALDARNGFRGYVFGRPITAYPTIYRLGNGVYVARNEPAQLGDVRTSTPIFKVSNGLLTGVEFSVSGDYQSRYVLEALTNQYGPPQELGIEKTVWRGAVATVEFTTNVTNFSAPIASIKHRRARVFIYNNALMAAETNKRASATKRAAADL